VSLDAGRSLRTTFDEVAELYDRARPRYPRDLFDDLIALTAPPESARILEIGCGTGQATVPLAERGFDITCIELGARLAAVARRNLARFPAVQVINADFESWQAPRAGFDTTVSFTAFHWIAPDVRYAKTASLLRGGGRLAVVTSQHVLADDGDEFFVDVQRDYDAVLPSDPATKAGGPLHPDAVPDVSEEIEASGFFRNTSARRYLWDIAYDADSYIDLLQTFSNHRLLDDETRASLLGRIHRRVAARPGGVVRKTNLALLNVAERL
jgi:SAM-dependent methyltransferase